MKLRRILLAVVALGLVVGAAWVAQNVEPSGVKMTTAAERFLGRLTPEQKAKATFAFDDKERFNWHFIPLQKDGKSTRKGLGLEEMNAEQRNAALELVRASTSLDGFRRTTTIMSLESILRELEKNGAMVRNPDWYFFAVFGTPGATGRWGWRVEGHHLSLNFTIENGKVVSATPSFLGANPATVREGPRKGLRVLAAAEDLARDLFKSLDVEQKKAALQAKHHLEVKALNQLPEVTAPAGLAAAKLNEKQRKQLLDLLKTYTSSFTPDVAEAEMQAIHQAGLDGIHFAWAGGTEDGQEHTYRIQGPTFLVEFLNIQADSAKNPANHIHTCWRSLKNDFGLAAK